MSAIPNPIPCLQLRGGKVRFLGKSGIRSGIDKQPLQGKIKIGFNGIVGDEQAESFHGGRDKALLHYDFAHYAAWIRDHAEKHQVFVAGAFGENIVSEGWNESTVCIGDRVRLGSCLLEVSEPRQPCFKLNHRFGIESMSHRAQETGRTGWYYRVLEEGEADAGDWLTIVDRVNPEWSISRVQNLLYRDFEDRNAAAILSQLPELSEGFRRLFKARVEQGGREDWRDRLWNGPINGEGRAWLEMRVEALRSEPGGVRVVTLMPSQTGSSPEFEAGAHIELKVENAVSRNYSLIHLPKADGRYEIAVQHVPEGRVSGYIHDRLSIGEEVSVGAPLNFFPLAKAATKHVFIAGGIGITPFLSMIEEADQAGAAWELHYCVRSMAEAAFIERLRTLPGGCVNIHTSDGSSGLGRFDIDSYCHQIRSGEHLYCCGPERLMSGFSAATAHWPADQVHREVFVAPGTDANKAFDVVIEPNGDRITVAANETLSQALQRAGHASRVSCGVGMCGTCVIEFKSGEVAHRDHFLTDVDRQKRLAACVSRGVETLHICVADKVTG